jgi:AcrR family transcriptional regulator
VAQEAGISRPVVHEHFGDLGGRLEALVNQMGAVLPATTASDDPREVLLAGLRGYLEVVRSDPTTWRLVLMPPEGAPEVLREQIAIGRNAVVAQLAETVRPGLGTGERSPDPELIARMLSTVADDAAGSCSPTPTTFP